MENYRPQLDNDKFVQIGRMCLCANLRRASRIITKVYDEFLQPSGLLTTQFILLAAIAAHSSVALTPLAEDLGMDPTTLARNLKPLERDGLLQIVTGTDRRTRVLKITDDGLIILEKACPLWEQAQAWGINHLGEERLTMMLGDWSDLVSAAR